MMSDRIDRMTETELREWARGLRVCCDALKEQHIGYPEEIDNHLKLIRPTPLDRMREFLDSDGWRFEPEQPRLLPSVGFTKDGVRGFYSHPDWK